MKVVHFSTQFDHIGGIENYLKDLLPAQVAAGAEVKLIVASSQRGKTLKGVNVRYLGAPIKIAGRYKYPRGIIPAALAAHRWADVVHVHVPFAISTIVPLLVPSKTPVILSCYAHPDHFESKRRRLQLRTVTGRATMLCVLSTGEQAVLMSAGVPSTKLQLVSSGISDEFLAVGAETSTPRDLILCVGRLVKYKRQELVVDACAAAGLLDRLRIVGIGAELSSISRSIARHGVDPAEVLLLARTDAELAELLGRARLLVSLSTQESLGLVLLEALASGARPLASDIPAHRDTLESAGLSEYLIPTDATLDSVAQRIRQAFALVEQTTWRPASWVEAAHQMLRFYLQVARGPL